MSGNITCIHVYTHELKKIMCQYTIINEELRDTINAYDLIKMSLALRASLCEVMCSFNCSERFNHCTMRNMGLVPTC